MQLKIHSDYDAQVRKLKQKGIIIEDAESCIDFLKKVNYYRFSAYFLPYKNTNTCISFDQLKRIYEFDSKLRNLLFPIIEQIEIKLRSAITYHFTQKYGAEGYLDPLNFSSRHNSEEFAIRIKKCIGENKRSAIVQHHESKYDGRFPLWVVVEFFSIGMLSYFYADLKREDKKIIAKALGYPSDRMLESWFRCITDLRNRCAHYSRLYYWIFTAIPLFPNSTEIQNDRSLYPQLLMLKYMVNDELYWKKEFEIPFSLLTKEFEKDIELRHMGLSSVLNSKLFQLI